MNLHCWRKTIKLLNLTNSVSNFNNNGSETEESGIKSTYRGGKACWSRGHGSQMRQETQGMLTCAHVSSQDTLTCEYISTQGMCDTWGT